jgi:hypothetical protein
MTALIISNSGQHSFGMMTNQMVGKMLSLNQTVVRLNEAVATAASGWTGTPGLEYEMATQGFSPPPGVAPQVAEIPPPNNFGVQQDPAVPGQKGSDFSYAIGRLNELWTTFWAEAQAYVEQLDNGGMVM